MTAAVCLPSSSHWCSPTHGEVFQVHRYVPESTPGLQVFRVPEFAEEVNLAGCRMWARVNSKKGMGKEKIVAGRESESIGRLGQREECPDRGFVKVGIE